MMRVVNLPPKEPARQELIDYAKELYDRVVTGDITAIAVVCVAASKERSGTCVETDWSFDGSEPMNGFMLAAGVSRLMHEMNKATMRDE